MTDQVKDTDENEEDDLELEIVDDTPEEDKGKTRKDDADTDDDDGGDDDDERQQYSERVQKRINKLKYETHEERRAREEAERLRDEAVNYARSTQEKLQRLEQEMTQGRGVLYEQAKGRIEAQMLSAQRALKDAYEEGDSDKIVEAQTKLSEVANEKSRLDGYKPRESSSEQKQQQQQPQQQQQQQQQRQRPQVSEKARKWANENEWFQKDMKMTAYAFGVHEDLIRNKGVKPDTEDYYRQLDQEMREQFPSAFKDGDPDDAAGETVVASPSRKSAKKPRTVRLTKTQVALAKRLGITPEQYAAQIIKEKNNG